jgi:hypothetical protein
MLQKNASHGCFKNMLQKQCIKQMLQKTASQKEAAMTL